MTFSRTLFLLFYPKKTRGIVLHHRVGVGVDGHLLAGHVVDRLFGLLSLLKDDEEDEDDEGGHHEQSDGHGDGHRHLLTLSRDLGVG